MNYKAFEYAKYNHFQRCEAFKCLAQNYDVILSLPYSTKALDIGCGTGDVTILLTYLPNINNVTAFDISKEMVDFAKTSNSDSKIQYVVADVEDISTWQIPNENAFDFVVSFTVLHWINNTQSAMNNIFRCLKSNGIFIARLIGRWQQSEIDMMEFLRNHEKWSKYAPQQSLKPQPWMEANDPAQVYSTFLKNAGFDQVLCTNAVVKRIIPSKMYMKEYLKMSRLYKCSMPESEFDEFADQCTDIWLKCAKTLDNGALELIVHVIDVKARKL